MMRRVLTPFVALGLLIATSIVTAATCNDVIFSGEGGNLSANFTCQSTSQIFCTVIGGGNGAYNRYGSSTDRTYVYTYGGNKRGRIQFSPKYGGSPFYCSPTAYVTNIIPVNGFNLTADAAISGHNIQQLSGVSPMDCAVSCSNKEWCVSFDYYKNSFKCDLSNKRAADVDGLKTNYSGNPYNHYSLKPTYEVNDYNVTKNAAISGYNNRHLWNVTPESCARECSINSSWCVSFDYYKNKRRCDLSSKSAQDVGGLKTNYSGNPYDHYSKK